MRIGIGNKLNIRTPEGRITLGAILILIAGIGAASGEIGLLQSAGIGAVGALILVSAAVELISRKKKRRAAEEDPWDRQETK